MKLKKMLAGFMTLCMMATAVPVTVLADNVIGTEEELKAALTADVENIDVKLGANLSYDVAAWDGNAMGGASTETITIDGQGEYTLTFNQTNSDWNNVVTNSDATLILKNMNITNSGHNDGPWNRHDINFGCDVEMYNVVSDKALAFKANATLDTVTISDANTSDTYAIWIQPNGQTVSLTNCTIDMEDCSDGRGIKIDEQYVDAPEKVTLNVKDTTFKTEEKSAILVKSKAGADIKLSGVNIDEVVADKVSPVWVDEDRAKYADKVNVEGGSKTVEGAIEIGTVDQLRDFAYAVDAGNSYAGKLVVLTADIDLYAVDENGERISFDPIGDKSAFEGTFDGQGHAIKNLYQSGWAFGYEWGKYGSLGLFGELKDATVKNLTISGAECFVEGGDVGGIAGSATGTCVFENITIEDSVFATYNNGNGGIIGWSGDGEYTFENIEIADDVVLAGLWGSFDSSIGGIVGQAESGATYNFEDVDIACRLDVYNDCTASYDYYNYRMCGMIMGRLAETTTIDGVNYPDTSKYNITCEDVTVTYGDWMNYHYCEPTPGYNNGRGMRVEPGYAYDGLPADFDHSQCVDNHMNLIPFDQIFGGDQYGVKGLKTYDGVTVDYSKAAVARIDSEYFLTLEDAVKEAVDGDTITLLADADFVNTSKTLTFKGATGKEKLTLGQAYGTQSGGMTFEDLTMVWTNENYKGLQHIGKEKYVNCVIEGQPFLYGEESVFENCTFNQTSKDAYNVWTYGSKNATFTECTFNSAGKAVLVYKEGAKASEPYSVTFEKCKFNASETVSGKAAIEIGSNLWSYNVTIKDCTFADTFDTAVSSGNNHWNAKNYAEGTENHSITVDGTKTTVTTGADGSGNLYTVVVNETTTPEEEPKPEPTPSTSSKKSSKKYTVEIEDAEDGTVKASSTRVKKGATVTLTVTPDEGYELDEIVVLDKDGDEVELKDKGDGKYTFVMPRGGVEVEASFEEADDTEEPVVDETEESAGEKEFIKLTIGQKIAWVFDEYVVNDVAPEINNERTMLPIRFVAEALGAAVTWNEAEQKVTITEDDLVIEIFIGQPFATVNGKPVQLDAPAYIANDRTYLPLRFVAENLGATVEWNAADSSVTIFE